MVSASGLCQPASLPAEFLQGMRRRYALLTSRKGIAFLFAESMASTASRRSIFVVWSTSERLRRSQPPGVFCANPASLKKSPRRRGKSAPLARGRAGQITRRSVVPKRCFEPSVAGWELGSRLAALTFLLMP